MMAKKLHLVDFFGCLADLTASWPSFIRLIWKVMKFQVIHAWRQNTPVSALALQNTIVEQWDQLLKIIHPLLGYTHRYHHLMGTLVLDVGFSAWTRSNPNQNVKTDSATDMSLTTANTTFQMVNLQRKRDIRTIKECTTPNRKLVGIITYRTLATACWSTK